MNQRLAKSGRGQERRTAGLSQGERESSLQEPMQKAIDQVRDYAEENPQSFALICLGVGFVLGWKLKPW